MHLCIPIYVHHYTKPGELLRITDPCSREPTRKTHIWSGEPLSKIDPYSRLIHSIISTPPHDRVWIIQHFTTSCAALKFAPSHFHTTTYAVLKYVKIQFPFHDLTRSEILVCDMIISTRSEPNSSSFINTEISTNPRSLRLVVIHACFGVEIWWFVNSNFTYVVAWKF